MTAPAASACPGKVGTGFPIRTCANASACPGKVGTGFPSRTCAKAKVSGAHCGGRGLGDRSSVAIVLAAGEGSRLRSARPKALHAIAGRSLIAHVLAAVRDAGD